MGCSCRCMYPSVGVVGQVDAEFFVDSPLVGRVGIGQYCHEIFAAELERRLVAKSEALKIRERHLDEREQSLRESASLLRARTRPLKLPSKSSIGRNDPCPCGSGDKYKRCHGN